MLAPLAAVALGACSSDEGSTGTTVAGASAVSNLPEDEASGSLSIEALCGRLKSVDDLLYLGAPSWPSEAVPERDGSNARCTVVIEDSVAGGDLVQISVALGTRVQADDLIAQTATPDSGGSSMIRSCTKQTGQAGRVAVLALCEGDSAGVGDGSRTLITGTESQALLLVVDNYDVGAPELPDFDALLDALETLVSE